MSRNLPNRWVVVLIASAVTIAGANVAAAEGEDPKTQAFELYQKSRQAYAEGKFDEAVELIRQAQALDSDPILTYNLARAFEASGKLMDAVATYHQYIQERPDAPDRGFVEGRISMLMQQMKDKSELERKLEDAKATSNEVAARARVEALSQETEAHIRAGRYDAAIRLLRECYAMEPRPVFLYRLGQTLERVGELQEAEQAYRTFVDAAPNAPERPDAEARLEMIGRGEVPAPGIGFPIEQSAEPRSTVPPIVVTSVGAGSLIVGAILSGIAVSKHDSWREADNQLDAVSALDDADSLALGSNVALGVGATLVVAGGIWWIVNAMSGGSAVEPSTVIVPSSEGAGARLLLSF